MRFLQLPSLTGATMGRCSILCLWVGLLVEPLGHPVAAADAAPFRKPPVLMERFVYLWSVLPGKDTEGVRAAELLVTSRFHFDPRGTKG